MGYGTSPTDDLIGDTYGSIFSLTGRNKKRKKPTISFDPSKQQNKTSAQSIFSNPFSAMYGGMPYMGAEDSEVPVSRPRDMPWWDMISADQSNFPIRMR